MVNFMKPKPSMEICSEMQSTYLKDYSRNHARAQTA